MNKYPNKKIINISKLTHQQLNIAEKELNKLKEKKLVSIILQEKSTVICPHCESKHIVKNGIKNDMQRYKCRSCKKSFNQLTGTPLARLRKKGRWLNYAECMKKGLTLEKSALVTEIHPTTAFRWRHRFLKNIQNLKPESLNGVAEILDTYFYYSEKGSHNPNPLSKETVEKKAPKVYVQILRDRYNKTNDSIIFNKKLETINTVDFKSADQDILYCTENNDIYKTVANSLGYRFGTINSQIGETVKKKVVHLNNANSYRYRLHDWMQRFHGVATKYLVNYLGWFRELDEYKIEIPSKVLLVRAKSLSRYPYHPLTL